jgi:hypothetical protein
MKELIPMQIAAGQMAIAATENLSATQAQTMSSADLTTMGADQRQIFDHAAQMQAEAENGFWGGAAVLSAESVKTMKGLLDGLQKDQNYTDKARRERKQHLDKDNESESSAIFEQPEHLGPAGQILEPREWPRDKDLKTRALAELALDYLDRQALLDLIFSMEKSVARSIDTLLKGQ